MVEPFLLGGECLWEAAQLREESRHVGENVRGFSLLDTLHVFRMMEERAEREPERAVTII